LKQNRKEKVNSTQRRHDKDILDMSTDCNMSYCKLQVSKIINAS